MRHSFYTDRSKLLSQKKLYARKLTMISLQIQCDHRNNRTGNSLDVQKSTTIFFVSHKDLPSSKTTSCILLIITTHVIEILNTITFLFQAYECLNIHDDTTQCCVCQSAMYADLGSQSIFHVELHAVLMIDHLMKKLKLPCN